MAKLTLQIVTQEKHMLTEIVDLVGVPAVGGELTILPHHLSLFTKLGTGEVKYQKGGKEISYVISGGFVDVSGGNTVMVLANSAIHSDEISIAKAQAAKERAENILREKHSSRESLLAEAELRRAILELNVARKKGYIKSKRV